MAAEIKALLQAKCVGSGYGSLAAGADILFAEALLARGANLNVVLPFAVDDFLDQSVRSAGGDWVERFHACLDAAKNVRYATEDSFMEHESLFNYCSQLGMGLAVLAARHMQAPVLQGSVWDGEARSGTAGTAVDMKAWLDAGLPQFTIRCGSRERAEEFELRAKAVIVTSGGIGHNHDLIRKSWPADRFGPCPQTLISGVPAHVDGRMLAITEQAGGRIVNRDRMPSRRASFRIE